MPVSKISGCSHLGLDGFRHFDPPTSAGELIGKIQFVSFWKLDDNDKGWHFCGYASREGWGAELGARSMDLGVEG